MDLCIMYCLDFPFHLHSADTGLVLFPKKYPGFADRVHEGLQDIFGDKGRCVLSCFLFLNPQYNYNIYLYRNIVTHHAEDGSGVGSAIIAGKLLASIEYRFTS